MIKDKDTKKEDPKDEELEKNDDDAKTEENSSEEDKEEEILESKETKTEEEESEQNKEKEEDQNNIDKLLRLQADFDNYRKRTAKEKEEIYKYSLADFVKKLLPVLDNMERAIKSIEDGEIDDPYVQGVKMVFTKLMEVLNSEGLEEIEAVGVQFNPEYHHGVAVENIEDVEDNQIIEVFQKGYIFKDKVLRPSMVKICKK